MPFDLNRVMSRMNERSMDPSEELPDLVQVALEDMFNAKDPAVKAEAFKRAVKAAMKE